MAGAVFTLYRWHGSCDLGSPVATATSDGSGHALFSLDGHHNYCVVETTAPAGYTLPATASQVVKTSHSTNNKGDDDQANRKESSAVTFVDSPKASAPTTVPSAPTTVPSTRPTTAGGGVTSTTAPPTAAAGSVVPNATTVHTGEPWAGSGPYLLGTAGMGALLTGAGLFWRRRMLHSRR